MKLRRATFLLVAVLLCSVSAIAQLTVSVLPVQVVGQKAVVRLKMKNDIVTFEIKEGR